MLVTSFLSPRGRFGCRGAGWPALYASPDLVLTYLSGILCALLVSSLTHSARPAGFHKLLFWWLLPKTTASNLLLIPFCSSLTDMGIS